MISRSTQNTAVVGQVNMQGTLTDGSVSVTPGQPLKVDITGFKYDIGGKRGAYDGAVAQTVADDDTSYLYLNSAGTLVNNITGFPTDSHIPLARVVAANGEVVAIYHETVLLASSSSSVGTCAITLPVDGDIRGGDTSASSNNNWAAVVYEGSGGGTDARNRLVRRVPQNYVSGDLVMRLICSVASGISGTNKSYWELHYKFADLAEALGSMASVSNNPDHDGQSADELFAIDLTIPEGSLLMSKEFMAFKLMRDHDHANDTMTDNIYVHNIEIRYTGRLLAGQAGQ